MKICIPTEDDRGLEGRAFRHFGRAPFYTLVDTEGEGVEILPNPDCHARPDSCHHIPQLKAHKVGVVICEGIGRRATAALEEAGIEVREPAGWSVGEIVEKVRHGDAHPVTAGDWGPPGGRGRRRGVGRGVGSGSGPGMGRGMGRGLGHGLAHQHGWGHGRGPGRAT